MSHFTDSEKNRKRLQQALINAGYEVGPDGADGVLGKNTAAAIKAFRKANGMSEAAVIDTPLLRALNLTGSSTMSISANWFSTFVASTAFKYILAMVATFIASKIGVDHASLEGILTQLIGVAAGVWGMYESSKSKIVVNGEKVNLAKVSAADQAKAAEIVAKHT